MGVAVQKKQIKKTKEKFDFQKLLKQKTLLFMSIPFVIWVIIFAYIPLWGWTMAFQDFKPSAGFFNQDFVGLKHFIKLFSDATFLKALRNTLAFSSLGMLFGFGSPIIFALLLNEIKFKRFKSIAQTISYLPHFISWVIAASIFTTILSNDGIVNQIFMSLGITNEPFPFLTKGSAFWFVLTFVDIWKEVGWNAIIYLAAIAGIDQQLYEAASVDGAGRWRKMFHVTLPGIAPTIIVLLIMSIGGLMNIGFERQKLLGNSIIKDYSLVIDQYALEYGIGLFRYSYGTAIGIFKSVVSLILMFSVNAFVRKKNETSLF